MLHPLYLSLGRKLSVVLLIASYFVVVGGIVNLFSNFVVVNWTGYLFPFVLGGKFNFIVAETLPYTYFLF